MDLDKQAILKAREQFKKENEDKEIAKEIDNMDDITFLNKAKVLLNGKVTRTALLLLGKEENSYIFEDFIPQITWKLQENGEILDYEHFTISFLLMKEVLSLKLLINSY